MSVARILRHSALVALLSLSVVSGTMPREASAQSRGVPVVRDAEIEGLVRDYARPIFRAAGLSKAGIDIILVNDPSFNAFVAGRRLFINTGALLQSETPNEIIGVIAHEAGHLAGGHQERLRAQLERSQTMQIVSALLGIGAAVAGAATNSSGLAGVGGGIAAGGAEMARRSMLSYQRGEEVTADRSALTYLEKTGQSPQGMIRTFERFSSTLALSGTRVDPYQLSHPLPRDRIANLSALAQQSRFYDKPDPEPLRLRHDLARAKIAAYTQQPGTVRRMFAKVQNGMAARYADAISTHLYGSQRDALRKIDELIRQNPKYAYFHEMRGEILLKANRPEQAIEAFALAARLDPADTGLMKTGYGHALVASGKPENLRKAIPVLKGAIAADRDNPNSYHLLAQAEGRLGNVAEAELATAQGHFASGRYQDAKIFATRAQMKMKRGTPGWLRAQDIIGFKIPGKQ